MDNQIFREGDRVYEIRHGWGGVSMVNKKTSYPLLVTFDTGDEVAFSPDGRYLLKGEPSLSFVDYSGDQPLSQERPRPDIKNGQLIYVRYTETATWEMRYFKEWRDGNKNVWCYANQKRSGYITPWNYYSLTKPLEDK